MNFDISLQGALRVEYRLQLKPLGETSSLLASEQRLVGGNGAVPALVLASLGARVRLRANPIGDDSHGRFLLSQLENVPGLQVEAEIQSDVATPYAILVREEEGATKTWLSPEAARLEGPQDYPALMEALRDALIMWAGSQSDNSHIQRVLDAYDAGFGPTSFKEEWG